MSKPEAVGYESVHRVRQEAQMEAIRVRQAHEAANAADKARIAALSEALQACLEVEERPEIVAMARKALAQQGKEGE